jgi:hypothetical protein
MESQMRHDNAIGESMPMSERPEPKFKVGQIVIAKHIKKEIPFRIVSMTFESGEWFYGWNKSNMAAEHMLRAQTVAEMGEL